MPTDPIDDLDACLAPGRFTDSDHPDVVAFAEAVTAGVAGSRQQAVQLFLAVRDGIRYDPYAVSRDPDDFRASRVVHTDRAWCVPKAVLLTAACRAAGIPARLGFADVRNHLNSEKLRATMGTDLFVFHGFSELWLGGRWVKVSSAFNRELCERFGTRVLDFDGEHDALMHPYDRAGHRHMEYVRERGSYLDLPLEEMWAVFRDVYPGYDDLPPVVDDAFHRRG